MKLRMNRRLLIMTIQYEPSKVEIMIVIQDNHLKPSGNYVHHMVYHYETVFCPHSVCALRMIPAINSDYSPTYHLPTGFCNCHRLRPT